MNAKRFVTYLATAAMLASTSILPATASAHDRYDRGHYRERHTWVEPAPKWRHHHRHDRRVIVREYDYTPRRVFKYRAPREDVIVVRPLRRGDRSDVGFAHWD